MGGKILIKKASWNETFLSHNIIVDFDNENIYLPDSNTAPMSIQAYKLKDASIQIIDEEEVPTWGEALGEVAGAVIGVAMLFDKSKAKAKDLQKQNLSQPSGKYSDKRITFILTIEALVGDNIKIVGELNSKEFKELQIAAI